MTDMIRKMGFGEWAVVVIAAVGGGWGLCDVVDGDLHVLFFGGFSTPSRFDAVLRLSLIHI